MDKNIFQCLKEANQVGGLDTSMQEPDIDEAIIDKALKGEFDSGYSFALALTLHSGTESFAITVGALQEAYLDGHSWQLPSGECLWIC